jgi:hypothetical protein
MVNAKPASSPARLSISIPKRLWVRISSGISEGVAFFFVIRVQQVKSIEKHMSRTACRVAYFKFFRRIDFQKIGFLLLRLYIILHLITKAGFRIVKHPQATERVFYKVANNPVGGKAE